MTVPRFCIIIPSYNHADTLEGVLDCVFGLDIIVVDDGSVPEIRLDKSKYPWVAKLIRIGKNSGKANALKVGFAMAEKMRYTHAITMDSDGQHSAQSLPDFLKLSEENPRALITGIRNFDLPGVPRGRRFLNKFSNFWFKYDTKMLIGDTQCGYRCYPLEEIGNLKMSFGGFVFETELLIKAALAGIPVIGLKIPTIYTGESVKKSHYRPSIDTIKFTVMNTKMAFMTTFLPKFLIRWAILKNRGGQGFAPSKNQ